MGQTDKIMYIAVNMDLIMRFLTHIDACMESGDYCGCIDSIMTQINESLDAISCIRNMSWHDELFYVKPIKRKLKRMNKRLSTILRKYNTLTTDGMKLLKRVSADTLEVRRLARALSCKMQ